ncbi:MAG TPA: hypothetical protein VF961_07505 [Pyrinomonadaceae bacterium]
MPTEKNKWIDAVGKLITLTQERKLTWRVATPYGGYEAENLGKVLYLYSTREDDETIAVLKLKDPDTDVDWEFPYSEANEHLMEAVKYQLVGVGDFLDDLLAQAV